jgi:hypothetical protein
MAIRSITTLARPPLPLIFAALACQLSGGVAGLN